MFLEVKRIFDPENILNPGKIVGDDPDLITDCGHRCVPPARRTFRHDTAGERPPSARPADGPRRRSRSAPIAAAEAATKNRRDAESRRTAIELGSLRGSATPWRRAIAAANAARKSPQLRMCPIFRCLPTEEASPRAKANLIRGVLTGTLDLGILTSDEFKAIADLCVHCHCCRLECPAGVDIPRLMREGKGSYVAANGLPLADWALTRLDLLGSLAA